MSRPIANQTDIDFQNDILQGVSRTFALTIPQLPEPLMKAVSNAYLLCRIADTIEDDPSLNLRQKKLYSDWFASLVEDNLTTDNFASELALNLGPHTSDSERLLIQKSAAVLRITHTLSPNQRNTMFKCVKTMTDGMLLYQGKETLDGLENQSAMDLYCYYVAGVVGEMLTELFLEYGKTWNEACKNTMLEFSTSFGQGLQMTNILKDIWADRERGACWVPRDIFEKENIVLSKIKNGLDPGFERCLETLIATTFYHLENALNYTLSIPKKELGIRRFCLWALFLAILTLRKIYRNPKYIKGETVKISRTSVKVVVFFTTILSKTNLGLRFIFFILSLRLPKIKKNISGVDADTSGI